MIWLLLLGCRPDAVCAPDGKLCTAAGVLGRLGFNGDGPLLETMFASPALQRAEPGILAQQNREHGNDDEYADQAFEQRTHPDPMLA